MTREEARKAAKVMLAYADGATVQYHTSHDTWVDSPNPSFCNASNYRVKPEPRVLGVNEYPPTIDASCFCYTSKEEAEKHAGTSCIRQVKFVEAVD